jgi:hypothetical protein
MAHNMNARHRDELQKDCQTSDMEKEQMRSQLRTAVLKAELLEKELHMIRKLREDDATDRQYERAYMMRRIRQMEQRESMLRAVLADYSSDGSSNVLEPRDEGNSEHALWYELTESRRNPYWESQERPEE